MAPVPELKSIALVGATGTLGTHILPNLLATFPTVTVLTRPDSDVSSLPKDEKLLVKRASSDDHKALVNALTGADALIITQGILAPPNVQIALIDAGVEAGVKWIFPNEYGSDTQHRPLAAAVPLMAQKNASAQHVAAKAAELRKPAQYIRLCTNPWYDFSLQAGGWGISFPEKKATFYNKGDVKTYTTTLAMAGLAIARLVALPEAKLQQYANGYVYVNSFSLTQREMLDSVQRVTGTSDADWTIDSVDTDAAIADASEALKKGEFKIALVYGRAFKPGMAGKFEGRELANETLGLPSLDLDRETKRALGL